MKSKGIFIYGMDEETADNLRGIAADLGLFVRRGTNTDCGNLAQLLRLIADVDVEDRDELRHLLRKEISWREIHKTRPL